ncbi:hypothetical protein GQ43DRAFT_441618 [Delitschia confertaspora ATCC 74209]|uniref:Uncharacterized protein n=1 Tax=Delitschia confertaspora ATCC 74209 TaxID=1513339 RepID=A0A9P4MRF8_9PLEO|nr:hypothetical protein GQ43DRAFT_441618 [Delitschia confertaspora ATCC 74209]
MIFIFSLSHNIILLFPRVCFYHFPFFPAVAFIGLYRHKQRHPASPPTNHPAYGDLCHSQTLRHPRDNL